MPPTTRYASTPRAPLPPLPPVLPLRLPRTPQTPQTPRPRGAASPATLTSRLSRATEALVSNPSLSLRRAAAQHGVPRTTLSRRLAPPRRGRVLNIAEERQVLAHIGQLEEMGVKLERNMLEDIAGRVLERRGERGGGSGRAGMEREEGEEEEEDGEEEDGEEEDGEEEDGEEEDGEEEDGEEEDGEEEDGEEEDGEEEDGEEKAGSVKDGVLRVLRERLDKETDPVDIKRLALRIGEFAAEALEYQDALEHVVERYNAALVRLQARHIQGSQESDGDDDEDKDKDNEDDEKAEMGNETRD
ncbi:hypothetical protein BZA05DRAFT_434790 [Tricharina praecox]|uniref:uncharacterized protein n=1 Tax=Tricharina praecox TaxID=43433 RepID=UPI0022200703|nr:uncharacterized protein BZA05DRAFT_434790 [Tricharina praecox]KAI5855496.1 hypothetical protein BZA05DRAFT_434790 [Tricharina praecox]